MSIESHVRMLCSRLGLPKPQHDLEALSRARAKGFGELAAEIMRHMGLNCKLRLGIGTLEESVGGYVNVGYVPPYGTTSFRNYVIDMMVARTLRDYAPLSTQVLVLAHEFAHIVLRSTDPRLNDEMSADITAICMGYDHVWAEGKKPRLAVPYGTQHPNPSRIRKWVAAVLNVFLLREQSVDFGYLSVDEVHTVCKTVTRLRTMRP